MANLTATPEWTPVRQLEQNELASGGPNGNMNEQAKALLNRTEYLNQQKADKEDIIQGQYSFATLAEFNAVKATLPVNSTVIIDEAGANQGTNTWNGTTLTKSAYDPLTQSKSYTDGFFTQYNKASLLTVLNAVLINGIVSTNTNFDTSDFIPVIGGESYNLYSYIAGTARHAWYDKDKVFISAFGDDQTALSLKTYIAPANARYIRVTAYTTARTVAYLNSKSYVVNKVKTIIEQHMPNVDSSKIIYGTSDVNATLNTVISKQNTVIANQNTIDGKIDLITDKDNPFFVNLTQYTKSCATPSNFNVVNVSSRISDNQMQVSDATAFVKDGACVVYDATANTYTSHDVLAISGTTITVSGVLPAAPSQAQTMHDAALGQHLSNFGYYGLADYMLSTVQKYAYKKDSLFFNFKPTNYVVQTGNGANITTDGTTIAIPVTKIGTAATGGWVAGTTNLAKFCGVTSGNLNIGSKASTQYLTKAYQLNDAVAGNGFSITINAENSNGFLEIPIAARDVDYVSSVDSQTYQTSGRVKLRVLNGTTVIHDQIYTVGQVNYVFVDYANAETLKVEVTCADAVPTAILLCGIFAYKKSPNTSKSTLFKSGDVIAFLGDSWTQYPLATPGETRPDGSVSGGGQYLSKRIKDKLATQGIQVTTLNMGKGGQTSEWGKYWINSILTLNPKPTHCVVCFYINDNNGINNTSATAYDFSPTDQWTNLTVANGGVSGRITDPAHWENNIKYICEKLLANGIKPIVFMPSHTASSTQAQSIRSNLLDRIADGFN